MMATLRELVLVVQAQGALLRARRRLRREPAGRVVAAVADDTASSVALERSDRITARRLERAVERASRRGLFTPLCLVRALALQSMLESRGLKGSRVRVGVTLESGAFAAHAWVEYGGLVLGDTVEHIRQFVPLSGAEVQPLP